MKKSIIYAVCRIVFIVIVFVLILFAFSGNNTFSNKTVDVEGIWRVVTYENNGIVPLIENEYIVFSEGQANAYCDRNIEPYVSSNYINNSALLMNSLESSSKYTIVSKSKYHMHLNENDMYIIHYFKEDMSNLEINKFIVAGKRDIVYRDSDTNYAGKYLIFENGMIYDNMWKTNPLYILWIMFGMKIRIHFL